MNAAHFSALRLQLWLARRSPVWLAALLLGAGAALAWAWYFAQPRRPAPVAVRAAPSAAAPATLVMAAPTAGQNLAAFRAALGQRRDVEQQLGTLFALAAKAGLTLSSGQYKAGYEPDSGVHTYQIILPVRGSYASVWQFCLQALAAIPFASLDEISFRRDAIADTLLEARLRFTLYLKDGASLP